MSIAVAGAPVSFGVFELTPEGAETVGPDALLATLAAAGYAGVDLGPVGYLGRGAALRSRLATHGLELAGGWVQLPFTDDEAFEASLPELHEAIGLFADAAESSPGRLPLPTLADGGSPLRRATPGGGARIDPVSQKQWERLIVNAERAAFIVRAHGFEPTFHHHAGTFVEDPHEIERFLAEVDVNITLDTGHLLLGGGDPLAAVAAWGHRINHVHLKDVDSPQLRDVLASGGGMVDVWSSGAFVALGAGDVPYAAVMDALVAGGFDGWVVIEQDVLNAPDIDVESFRAARAVDQATNREALRPWA